MFGLSGAELAAAEQDAARALAAADVHLQAAERQLRAPRPAPPLAPGETPLGLPKAGEDWRDVWRNDAVPAPAESAGGGGNERDAAGEAQPARGDGGGSDDDSDDADDGGNAAADPAAADAAYRRGCDALDAGLLDEAIEALRCAARDCPAAYPVARGKIAQQLALARQRAAARAAGT